MVYTIKFKMVCKPLIGICVIVGAQIDIHAGGVDLRFPHNENEEAQCCSYYCQPQWVNYWLHTGHLHMQDSVKMSKSLKNTISIRDMLKCCDSNIFRIMCLMSHYSYNMEFNMDYVKKAQAFSNTFINFVSNCNALISGKTVVNINTELLNKTLMESVVEVHNAFIDDFDTATCLKVINSLIATTNIMIHAAPTSVTNNKLSNLVSVISVLNFVTNIYKLLGISLDNKEIDLVHSSDETDNLIDLLINFRQNIRQSGIQSKDKHLMELCDNVRDALNKIGITVKDHGKTSSWSK